MIKDISVPDLQFTGTRIGILHAAWPALIKAVKNSLNLLTIILWKIGKTSA